MWPFSRCSSIRKRLSETQLAEAAFGGVIGMDGVLAEDRALSRLAAAHAIATFEATGEVFVETPQRGVAAYARRMGGDPDIDG